MSEGVLVVDKPRGMTSHDVVARVRRLLGTRRVGHAGTLDPMATGVLVVLVGEATKLGPYLTADDKRYLATIALGRATDTLDADGRTTATDEAPAWLREALCEPSRALASLASTASPGPVFARLAEALAAELARAEQVPPAYSAIHVEGRRSHELARAGESVPLAPRPVKVHGLEVVACGAPEPPDEPWISVGVHVSKGYYVRSLARDLGARLGVPAHLAALRRLSSGAFHLETCVDLEGGADSVRAALIPVAEAAAKALPLGRLTAEGVARVRQGKPIQAGDFSEVPPFGDAAAWLGPDGRLAAIGARAAPESATDPPVEGERFTIARGFGGGGGVEQGAVE
jgi:tRNA pseudouridine55 synthase